MAKGDLVVCETLAAIVRHLRGMSERGPMYGGGADTLAICGAKVSWDTREPVEAVARETRDGMRPCRPCFEGAGYAIPRRKS